MKILYVLAFAYVGGSLCKTNSWKWSCWVKGLCAGRRGLYSRWIDCFSNLMPFISQRLSLSLPPTQFPGFSIATACLGSPPPVETWDWALPGTSADRGREETVGQRRHLTAHPAAPHQGELVRPLAESSPLPAASCP